MKKSPPGSTWMICFGVKQKFCNFFEIESIEKVSERLDFELSQIYFEIFEFTKNSNIFLKFFNTRSTRAKVCVSRSSQMKKSLSDLTWIICF